MKAVKTGAEPKRFYDPFDFFRVVCPLPACMNPTSRNAHWWGMGGVALAAAILLVILFGPVLAHPNNYFFKAGGDALQSYYATAFYTLHDSGNRFTGMNYPFGEHFNYPNLQPLIAATMAFLERLGLPVGRYTVGITNVLALSSLVVTPVVMYAILRRTRLPVLYAGVLALLIGFMAPQVLRLDGHVSLSYACFVPMLWYCIIRMQEAPRAWRWYVLFGLCSILTGAVMLYFLACGCFFLLGHVLVLAWQQPRMRPWLGRMLLAALLPLLLFRGYIWATDHVTDRPPNPYGLTVYLATLRTVFTPVLGPLHDWWRATWPSDEYNDEGFSYIGLVATATLLASVVLGVVAAAGAAGPAAALAHGAVGGHAAAGAGLWHSLQMGVVFVGHGPFRTGEAVPLAGALCLAVLLCGHHLRGLRRVPAVALPAPPPPAPAGLAGRALAAAVGHRSLAASLHQSRPGDGGHRRP